jgi:hypothetical protein
VGTITTTITATSTVAQRQCQFAVPQGYPKIDNDGITNDDKDHTLSQLQHHPVERFNKEQIAASLLHNRTWMMDLESHPPSDAKGKMASHTVMMSAFVPFTYLPELLVLHWTTRTCLQWFH